MGAQVPGPYLLMLAKNPQVRTEDEIRALLDANRSMHDPQKLKALAHMVAKANPGLEAGEPEVAQAADISVILSPEPKSEVSDPFIPEEKTLITPPPVSVPGTYVPEPDPVVEVAVEPPLDPSRFMDVDAMAKPARLVEIEVQSLEGKQKLSWPPSKDFITYAIATGEDSFQKSLARAAKFAHTRDLSVELDTDHDYFTLFGFKAADKPGVLIGYGRRLEEVSRFQVEEFQSQIRMLWSIADQSAKVVLYKSQPNQPLSANPSSDRIIAQSIGDGTFVDEAVSPGEDYEYRVCVQWESPSRVITTAGKTVTAGVYAPVPNIEEFEIDSAGDAAEVEISYRKPQNPARVRLFQVRGLPSPDLLAAHQDTQERDINILSGDNLPEWLGTEIIADARTSGDAVSVKSPILSGQIESRTYIGVSVLGRRFRVMALRAIPQVGPINGLQLIDRYDYQLLRVATPPGAQYLEVWVAGENAKFEQISKLPPDRQVQLIDEYRRFGGVVFADNLVGIAGSASLGSEPKEIFVRGATNFEGIKHYGPASSITHKGQIAVRFTNLSQQPQVIDAQRGLFGKAKTAPVAQAPSFVLGLQSDTPNRFGGSLTLRHLAAPEYPLDTNTANATLFDAINVMPGEYDTLQPYRDQAGRTRLIDPSLRHRIQLITDAKGNIQNFPAFSVNTMPDNYAGYRQNIESINAELKIVILGSKQSGKTTYIQALLNYLQHQFSSLYVAKLMAASDDPWAAKRIEEMEEFVTHGTLPPATRTAKPFYENPNFEDPSAPNPMRVLNFEIDNGSRVPLRKLGLVDVAGEDMDQLETMRYYEQSIMDADLIILLADPLQLGPVQVAMAGLPLPPKGTDPHIVLRNLNELITESTMQRNPKQKFAVVFSKFDGFQTLSQMEASPISGLIQGGMAITRDPNSFSQRLYNDSDGALVQQEILAIMNRLQLAPFVKLLENTVAPQNRRFFVASSLGHSSHSDVMDAAGLTSWRISDPIRWTVHNW